MTGAATADGLLTGCAVLPPMDPRPAPSPPPRPRRRGKAKGPAGAKPAGGRFAVVNAFVDFTLARLLRSEAAVWLVLWRDTKSCGTARTSQADLARRAGCDPRTVKRAVQRLQALGLLGIVRRGRLGSGPSVYRVRPTPLE